MDDLYRPLGLDLDLRRRRPPAFARPRPLLAALSLALVLGGSLATSLTQPSFRRIDVFAEAEREAEAARGRPVRVVAGTSLRAAGDPDPVRTELPAVTYPPGMSGDAGRVLTVRDPGSVRQEPRFAAEPDEALVAASDDGPLPIRAADGRRPFDVYQVQPSATLGTRVAIVVGGLGISQTGTMKAVRTLPPGVTLAFASAGNSLDRWMKEARRSGHELLLQLPMEPVGYPDVSPGEHTVTAEDAAAGRFGAMRWSLGRLTNYVGVMNYMGARLTGDAGAMRGLSAELARRGLLYLDDGASSRSLAREAAREAGAVYAGGDVVLDAEQDPAAIARRLDMLERAARAKGQAIGTASAFDLSIGAIAAWIREAEKRGVSVVPVSALADDPEAQ